MAVAQQAITAARKSKLDKLVEEGDKRSQSALWIVDHQATYLLAIRLGLLSVCLLTGLLIFAYQTASSPDGESLWRLFLMLLVALTGFSVVFALAARRVAVGNAESILIRLAWIVKLLGFLFVPLTSLANALAVTVFRMIDAQKTEAADEIEEEVSLLLEQGAQDGLFERAEQDMVERIFTLDDVRASTLMTPRTQIVWLDLEETPDIHLETVRQSGHSRFPVARGSLDDVAGVVFAKDLLTQTLYGQGLEVEKHIRIPVFVPKSMSGLRILELFKKAGTHIALVIDEYGGVLGLITINDILEHIVGDMPLADEPEEAMVVQREDGSWLIDGMLPVEDLKALLAVEELPAEDRESYQTAGGFVTSYLERIPAVSEFFVWNDWRFEVLDMDRSRIDKILVSQVPSPVLWDTVVD